MEELATVKLLLTKLSTFPDNLAEKSQAVNIYNNTCMHQKPTLIDKSCQTLEDDVEDAQAVAPAHEVSMESEDILKCTICNKSLDSTAHLEEHFETAHDQPSCASVVPQTTDRRSGKEVHEIICDHCDENFLSSLLLQEHISARHSTAYLQCQSCMLRFQTRTQLRTHVKAYHEPPTGPVTSIGASCDTSTDFGAGPSSSLSSSRQSLEAPNSKNL